MSSLSPYKGHNTNPNTMDYNRIMQVKINRLIKSHFKTKNELKKLTNNWFRGNLLEQPCYNAYNRKLKQIELKQT